MVTKRKTRSRENILKAAAELFYEFGIHTTSVDTVVARAGVTKPTFYQHFSSKADLVTAVVELRSENWNQAIEHEIAQAETDEGRLLAVFNFLESFIADDSFRGCALVNASVEVLDPSSPARKVAESNKKSNRDRLLNLATALGIKDPESLAWDLSMLFEGAIISAYVENNQEIGRRVRQSADRIIQNAR